MYRESILNPILKKYAITEPVISPINTGGSSRKYFRIKDSKKSYIYCEYNDAAELERFVKITKILKKKDINVQNIIEFSDSEKFILLQDLGDYNVYEFLSNIENKPLKTEIIEMYKSIIDLMIKMQISCADELKIIFPERKFDESVYLWETDYFKKMVLEKYLCFAVDDEKYIGACKQISSQLSLISGFFIHRDFQSQNIIIFDKIPYFIDYQTAYSGSNFYDPVSLLYDPYSYNKISDIFEILYNYYKTEFIKKTTRQEQGEQGKKFDVLFTLTGIQRLMQANAAYVKLGLLENKKFFARFVDPTLSKLYTIIAISDCAPEYFKYIFTKLKEDGKIKCVE